MQPQPATLLMVMCNVDGNRLAQQEVGTVPACTDDEEDRLLDDDSEGKDGLTLEGDGLERESDAEGEGPGDGGETEDGDLEDGDEDGEGSEKDEDGEKGLLAKMLASEDNDEGGEKAEALGEGETAEGEEKGDGLEKALGELLAGGPKGGVVRQQAAQTAIKGKPVGG